MTDPRAGMVHVAVVAAPAPQADTPLFHLRSHGDVTAAELERLTAVPAPQAQPLNGIKATMFHDEGAYAQCGNCARYSLNPQTLTDQPPACECGQRNCWTGSFKRPGPAAKWCGDGPNRAAPVVAQAQPAQQPAVRDLRCAKWLDPECAEAGACQSLRFKRPAQQPDPRDETLRVALARGRYAADLWLSKCQRSGDVDNEKFWKAAVGLIDIAIARIDALKENGNG